MHASLLVGMLTSAGCGHHPHIRGVTGSSVVLAFGDSLTAGTGTEPSRSYPAMLAELLGCRVINAGVPGELTAAGLARLPAVLRRTRPDLVLLCHGGNDMLQKLDDESLRENLDHMITLAQGAGADVVLVGVPRPGLRLKAPPVYKELARAHAIPLDSDTLPKILRKGALKSDPVHPNAAGYQHMAEALATLIRNCEA